MDQIRDVNVSGSLGFIPICPKNIGLSNVKMHDSIAISLLKIFLVNKNKPIIPKKETSQFIVCLISTVYLISIKLFIIASS